MSGDKPVTTTPFRNPIMMHIGPNTYYDLEKFGAYLGRISNPSAVNAYSRAQNPPVFGKEEDNYTMVAIQFYHIEVIE